MTKVFENDFEEFSAKIEKVDAVYRFSWTDNIANEWEEYYPSLAIATARLSALLEGVENDSLFSSTPEQFAKNFENFVSGELV